MATFKDFKARFIRRISAVSNTFKTIDNEMICFIIFCLNCIRRMNRALVGILLRYNLPRAFSTLPSCNFDIFHYFLLTLM